MGIEPVEFEAQLLGKWVPRNGIVRVVVRAQGESRLKCSFWLKSIHFECTFFQNFLSVKGIGLKESMSDDKEGVAL